MLVESFRQSGNENLDQLSESLLGLCIFLHQLK